MAVTVVLTGTAQNITASNGSPNITVASTAGWAVGATIRGTGFAAGTKIVSFVANTSAVLSNNFTGTSGTVSVIVSSNTGTLTVTLSASGDTASPTDIINAGFGLQRGNKTLEIFGATKIILNIATGATYDDTEWVYELGNGSSLRMSETYGCGTWRSGWILQGSTYVKAKGHTVNYSNFDGSNNTGGRTIFYNSGAPTGWPTSKPTIHWNDTGWYEASGNNAAAIPDLRYGQWSPSGLKSGRMVFDYQGDSAGANSGFGGSFGTIESVLLNRCIGGVGTGVDSTSIVTIEKFEYFSLPTGNTTGTNPDIKMAFPNNVPFSGFAPIFYKTVTSEEFLGANTTATEILDDYVLPTDYPLITNSRNYNTNTRTYRRSVNFTIKDGADAALGGVTTYITSGANVLVNAVQAGNYSGKLNTVVVSWVGRSPASGSYIAPLSSTDTRVQKAQFRKTGYVSQTVNYDLTNAAYSAPVYLLSDPAMGSVTAAQAAALTGVSIDYTNKVVTGSTSRNLDEVYAWGSYSQALISNSAQPDYQSSNGGTYALASPWKLNWTGGALTMGTYNKTFKGSTQWKFTGSTSALTVSKTDIVWTPATFADQISFITGATFNITNSSTLTVNPTANLGYGSPTMFGTNTTLNMSDSQFVANLPANYSGAIFSANFEAAGTATVNLTNATWTINGAASGACWLYCYWSAASTVNNWTVNGTGVEKTVILLGYNNQKLKGLSFGGTLNGSNAATSQFNQYVLMDGYTYTGSGTVLPLATAQVGTCRWVFVDSKFSNGNVFRWTANASSGYYATHWLRPAISVDKTGYAPKMRLTPSAMANRYPGKVVQTTALSTVELSNFYQDSSFAAGDGALPFIDSLDARATQNLIDWTLDFRQNGWLGQTVTFTAATAKAGAISYTASGAVDSNYINDTTGAADAALITVDETGKTIAAASGTLAWSAQRMYNALVNKWSSFGIEQNIASGSTGGKLDLADYTVASSIKFVRGTTTDLLSEVKTTGIIQSQDNEIPVADVNGSRASISGTDPQGFGVTWFLRWKKASASTWTTASGTGNSTQIVVDQDVYTVQARVPGYDWKTITFDTTLSLSLDLGLAYHISANNTPQYTMAYDSALEAIFSYDATAMKVAVVNSTSGILQPGFAELYRATQRIQHIPSLVWVWTAPVTANSTSQKILIPTGNPISMYLTDASTNTVKITCPVIHADTGQSADDRVRGNASGYSIILGSPATAESAGLASQIISGLGGPGYVAADHSLSVIKSDQDLAKAVLDLVKTAVDAIKPRTDLIPNEPAAVGSPMTLASGVVANANIVQVNAVPVSGTGAEGDEWGPAA